MNRAIQPEADSSLILYPGHIYRLLLIVNGPTTVEDLARALVASGFDPTLLQCSAPDEWRRHRPGDWPSEPAPSVHVNECLVRVTARFIAPHPLQFVRDLPIDPGASFTIAAAWDYVRGLGERGAGGAGMMRVGQAPSMGDTPQKSGTVLPLLAGAAMVGIGIWATWRAQKRIDKDSLRMRELMEFSEHEERKALAARAGEMAARAELDAARALEDARQRLELEADRRSRAEIFVED